MKKHIQNIIDHFSEKKAITNNSKVPIFFICLCISVIIWLLIKMSQDYTTELIFPIQYTNPPQDQILTNSIDTSILLEIKSKGFDLINLSFLKKKKPLIINLSGQKIVELNYTLGSYILMDHIRNQIEEQLKFADKILDIKPDTLRFYLESIASKKVEIEKNFSYSLKPQHHIYGGIEISPKNITVSGPPSIIDTISIIKTAKLRFNNLNKNLRKKIPLLIPCDNNVKLSKDSIELMIPVEKFTEGVVNVPILVKNPPKNTIKLFPEMVKITYLIALKDYSNFKAVMINAGIEFDPDKSRHAIKIFQKPSYIKITNIYPQSVEHLYLK